MAKMETVMRRLVPLLLKYLNPSFYYDRPGSLLFVIFLTLPVIRMSFMVHGGDVWQAFLRNGHIVFLEIGLCVFLLGRGKKIVDIFRNVPLYIKILVSFWLFSVFVSSIFSLKMYTAFGKSFEYFVHLCYFFVLISTFPGWYVKYFNFISGLIFGCILYIVILCAWLFASDIGDGLWKYSMRGFVNVRHFDYYIGFVVCFLVVFLISGKDSLFNGYNVLLVIIGILWFFIFWSGGRGAFLSVICSVSLIIILFKDKIRLVEIYKHASIMIIALLISLCFPVEDASFGFLRFFAKTVESESLNEFSAGRIAIWIDTFNIWLTAPWFGVGAGQTALVVPATRGQFLHPHNIVLQALLAWGVVGALPFLTMIFGGLIVAFKRNIESASPIHLSTLASALMLAFNSLIDGSLYHPFPTFLFATSLAIALSNPKTSQ